MDAAAQIIRSLQRELAEVDQAAKEFRLKPLPGETVRSFLYNTLCVYINFNIHTYLAIAKSQIINIYLSNWIGLNLTIQTYNFYRRSLHHVKLQAQAEQSTVPQHAWYLLPNKEALIMLAELPVIRLKLFKIMPELPEL